MMIGCQWFDRVLDYGTRTSGGGAARHHNPAVVSDIIDAVIQTVALVVSVLILIC